METAFAIVSFVIVSAITPGPNNLMLAATGLRFGCRASVPHLMGIRIGFCLMLVLCALGLDQLLTTWPPALLILRVTGSIYLLYLAWKIMGFRFAPGSSDSDEGNMSAPLTMLQALLFQFANPKAWVMSISGIALTASLLGSLPFAVIILLLCFASIGIMCNWLWVLMGASIRHYLNQPAMLICANAVLALLTVATVGMFWI